MIPYVKGISALVLQRQFYKTIGQQSVDGRYMSCSTMNYSQKVLTDLKNRYSTQPEFIQAATEILTGLQPVLDKHPEYQEQSLLERLVEPERIIMFRVPWVDDLVQNTFHTCKKGNDHYQNQTNDRHEILLYANSDFAF